MVELGLGLWLGFRVKVSDYVGLQHPYRKCTNPITNPIPNPKPLLYYP